MTYWFDMDGTIADFYSVSGWLDDLIAENTRPYEMAQPLVNMSRLARYIHKVQAEGNKVAIISWCSKNSSENFENMVRKAKIDWLAKHLPSVAWDEIHIVSYGLCKKTICGDGILFDDEEQNRMAWGHGAYEPQEIFKILR